MIQFPNIDAIVALAETNDLANAFLGGKLRITVTSLKTGEHISINADAKVKSDNGKWVNARLTEATHLFFKDPNLDWQSSSVGTYYPQSGKFYTDSKAGPVMHFVAQQLLTEATSGQHHPQMEIRLGSHCLRCGAELSDPKSIDRSLGPECYGTVTGSKHTSRAKRGVPGTGPKQTLRPLVDTSGVSDVDRGIDLPDLEDEVGYYAHADARRSDDR